MFGISIAGFNQEEKDRMKLSVYNRRPLYRSFLKNIKIIGCLVLLSGVLLSCCQDLYAKNRPRVLSERISKVFREEMSKSKPVGGLLLVMQDADTDKPKIISSSVYGLSDIRHKRKMGIGQPFRYASISKTFVAMLAVRLQADGLLDLRAKITENMPGTQTPYLEKAVSDLIPHAGQVSLLSLLDHSCSVFDYRDDAFTQGLLANPFGHLDEKQTLLQGLKRGKDAGTAPTGCKGFYSNSNYVVIGLILDRILGRHHSEDLLKTLRDGMQLTDIYYEKHYTWDSNPDLVDIVHAYIPDLKGGGQLVDLTWADDGAGFANGGLIGTANSLAVFFSKLFSEREKAPMGSIEKKREFLKVFTAASSAGTNPGNVYAKGYYFHAGFLGGYSSLVKYSPETNTVMVFMTNDGYRNEGLRFAVVDKVTELLDPTRR